MNTTPETAPNPGYYVPTPADCLEAGMIQPDERCIFFWVDHTLPALQEGDPDIRVYLKYGDRITFYPIESNRSPVAYFECAADQSMNHELVFANRDACMAFLRNHIVPTLKAGGRYRGKIIMPTTLEEMDEASAANARKMWDDSAPVSDWQAFISAFDQITLSVDERMDFVLKTHWGACAVLYACPGGDYSKLIDKTITGFRDLQAKISAHLATEEQRKSDKIEGGLS